MDTHRYVRGGVDGRSIDRGADQRAWKALLQAAGGRDARLHDARHTAATMLHVLGVPTRAVMEGLLWKPEEDPATAN